jgi:RpiR family transcriptional regulator, carbohydrate utilization regulator
MPGIIAKLNSVYNSITDSEKRVANYIFKNEDRVPLQSIYEIAGHSSVSATTILRLIKKIGYSSFKKFKIDLAKDSANKLKDIYSGFNSKDSDESIIRKVFLGNIESIKSTMESINTDSLIKASNILLKAKRIVFFGVGGSRSVAFDSALRFSHLDIQAEVYCDSLQVILQAKRLKKGEAAIGISHSGRTSIIIDSLNIARTNGATTIGISNYIDSPISKVCDYIFYTLFKEDRVRTAALSSNIVQLCIISSMYILVAKNKNKLWNINSLNHLVDDLLRLKY